MRLTYYVSLKSSSTGRNYVIGKWLQREVSSWDLSATVKLPVLRRSAAPLVPLRAIFSPDVGFYRLLTAEFEHLVENY